METTRDMWAQVKWQSDHWKSSGLFPGGDVVIFVFVATSKVLDF
jgi:hypothetical protein